MNLTILRAFPVILLLAGCATLEEMSAESPDDEAPAEITMDTASPEATEDGMAVTEAAISEPAATTTDRFSVYFALDSWILTDEAEATIDDAVAASDAREGNGFAVVGHADAVGAEQQNERMSKLRAEAVADALVARGIGYSAIEVSWQGASELAVATSGGSPEQANRRVTIDLK